MDSDMLTKIEVCPEGDMEKIVNLRVNLGAAKVELKTKTDMLGPLRAKFAYSTMTRSVLLLPL